MVAALQRVADGECTRLMLFMPPRYGKSRTGSELFPAYYIGRHPHHRIIGASYGDSLATDFGAAVRAVIEAEEWPFADVGIAGRSTASGQWRINNWGGRFFASGIGGGIIGRGANLLMIDDPIKTQKEADSADFRQSLWDWYEGVARRRLENELTVDPETGRRRKGAIVLIQTRWHEDDLAGRLLKQAKDNPAADQWEVLSFPAIAEEGDPLGREPGEVLWPAKYDEEEVYNTRANTAPRIWSAQYQQKPLDAGAALFAAPWFNHRYNLRVLPVYHKIVQTCDAAWKTGVQNSYSVIATWGLTDLTYDLLDLYRDRVAYPSLIAALRDNYWKWQRYGLDALYIEDAASGQSAIQTLTDEPDPAGRGVINVMPFAVSGIQQYSFVETATPFFAANRVRLPESAPWLADWIREHTGYPTEAQDDTVITTAMALRVLSGEPATRSQGTNLAGFGRGTGKALTHAERTAAKEAARRGGTSRVIDAIKNRRTG